MRQLDVVNSTSKRSYKLNHIDQLRGVAILLVVLTHVSHSQLNIGDIPRNFFDFGKVGVDLFFFLSAYTLCLSMTIRKEGDHIIYFYIRRFFRIAPLYYIGVMFYFIISCYALLNQNGPLARLKFFTADNILSNVFFIHGFVPSANNTIVPGGWSIGTEMIFYLLFPLLFYIYSVSKRPFYFLFIVIAGLVLSCLFIVSEVFSNGVAVYSNTFYYYNIFNQLPVFLVGMSYFFLEKMGYIDIKAIKSFLLFGVLFLLSFVLMHKIKNNITVPVFVAALSFAFLFSLFKDKNFNLSILQRIGQLSFSIYIFHFIFAYPLTHLLLVNISDSINPYILFFITFILTVILSCLLANISEKYIEKPGIKLGKLIIDRLKRSQFSTKKMEIQE